MTLRKWDLENDNHKRLQPLGNLKEALLWLFFSVWGSFLKLLVITWLNKCRYFRSLEAGHLRKVILKVSWLVAPCSGGSLYWANLFPGTFRERKNKTKQTKHEKSSLVSEGRESILETSVCVDLYFKCYKLLSYNLKQIFLRARIVTQILAFLYLVNVLDVYPFDIQFYPKKLFRMSEGASIIPDW